MDITITESLAIDLKREVWKCRKCGHEVGSAKETYKKGLLVQARNPREVHQAIIDPDVYEYTFAPNPKLVSLVEYYCPGCGLMMEVEYLPPGHPPLHDLDLDLDSLRAIAKQRTG